MANHELDQLFVTNPTDEPFTVKWAGVEYTLMPGEKKIWMRFLAEHFAKHLTNSILLKKEQAHKKEYLAKGGSERDYIPKSYMNSRELRPITIQSILTGVYQYHQQNNADPSSMIQQQIDQLNPQAQNQPKEREIDAGEAPDPLYGVLKGDAPDDTPAPQTAPANAGQSMIPDAAPMPPAPQQTAPAAPDAADAAGDRSFNDLKTEAKKLGITVPVGTSKEQLKDMIRKQYA